MSSRAHEPREEFVDELESRLRAELRRLTLAPVTQTWSWMPQSRWAAGLALSAVMVVSMALGGGVVAATYEARLGEQRDVLLATFDQRFAIAQQQSELAKRQLQELEQRVSIGVAPPETVLDMRFKVNEAEAELRSIGLDLEEIRATGREPMHSLTAPLVSGRDFVAERWRAEMTAPTAALALEKTRAAAARGRVEVGIGKPSDVDAAATRIAELEAAIETFERKLAIRQTYLKGGLPAQVAELQGLQAENEGRRAVLTRRIEAARRRVQDLEERIAVGTANPIELGEAKLRLQELQLEMSKADYDLLLIRKQLGK
jgi:outer membrane protein TolC